MLRIALLLGLALALSACGWHIRGTAPGSASLQDVTLVLHSPAGTGPLYREVRSALQAAGADVVEPRPGVPTVVLYSEQRNTRTVAGGRSAEVQEFELRYEVDWALLDGQGEPLVDRTTFRQYRNYRFERAQVLGSERREDMVVTELRRDAAILLTNRVQSVVGERDD